MKPMTPDQQQELPWHSAFPESRLSAPVFPKERAVAVLSMRIASMLLVDVRRTDYEGGAIRGSINIPAQGFWWNRGILYELAYKSDMEWVVFTCGSCKEGSRAARCAAWFLDHVRNTAQDENMQVTVLEGGMKGWIAGGEEYTRFVDGYDPGYWKKQLGHEVAPKSKTEPRISDEKVEGSTKEKDKQQAESWSSRGERASKEKIWSWEAMMDH